MCMRVAYAMRSGVNKIHSNFMYRPRTHPRYSNKGSHHIAALCEPPRRASALVEQSVALDTIFLALFTWGRLVYRWPSRAKLLHAIEGGDAPDDPGPAPSAR